MDALNELARRVRGWFTQDQVARDLNDEMQAHVALREEKLRASGMSPADARRVARGRFGNMRRLQDEGVDAWGWRWLEQLGQDIRFGARMLIKSPAVTIVGIVTLALATGATTAIFSVLNGVVLRPLPFAEPDRLVQVYGRDWGQDRGGVPDPVRGPVNPRDLDAFKESRSFRGFSAYDVTTMHVEGAGGTERLSAVRADTNLFAVLGVHAALGRTFQEGDPENVAVISRRLWRERFDSDPALAGRTISLGGAAFTVLGMMPEDFQFPYRAASLLPGAFRESRTDVWLPTTYARDPATGQVRRGRRTVVARLAPGVPLGAGLAELRVIGARVEAQEKERRVGVRLEPLQHAVLGTVSRKLWMLFGAVGLVLAAACLNMANLMLARLTVRTREVLTRAALGAGRARLLRQFLSESVLLALAGGLAGIAVARWGSQLLITLAAAVIPRSQEVHLDWQAFAFLLLSCVIAAVAFGIAPALLAARLDVSGLSREAGGTATSGRRFARLRDGLVIAEVTLAFVLAVGACLMVREIIRLRGVDTGMAAGNVLVLHVSPKVSPEEYYGIEQRVARLPGVSASGFIQLVPMQNWGWQASFSIDGRPDSGERRTSELRYVTPGYFRAAGIPLRRGRLFTGSDVATAPTVVLINEALARRYFPNEDPVGIKLDRGVIVGVVGDVRSARLDLPAEPELYYAIAQNVAMTSDLGLSLLVRTPGDAESLTPAIRAAVFEVNPKVAIFNVRTMSQVVEDSMWEVNLYRWLIGLFALLALVLATIGLYGVITYTASARTREFAIRRALGSNRAAIGHLVLKRGFVLTVTGLLLGGFVTWVAASIWRGLPISSGPDALTYAIVSSLLLATGLLACAVPAWRSSGVDPITALRHE
jgi:predicted permease